MRDKADFKYFVGVVLSKIIELRQDIKRFNEKGIISKTLSNNISKRFDQCEEKYSNIYS